MQCQCTDKANFLTLDPDHRHQHKRHTKGKKIRKYKEIGVLPNVRDKKKKGNFFEFVYFLTILSGGYLKVRKIADPSIPEKKTRIYFDDVYSSPQNYFLLLCTL